MKHLNQNQEFRFNEILFEHRNKEYGAYALRNESDRILTKALFVGVSLLAAVSITPFVISAFTPTETVVINDPIYRPIDIIPNDPPKENPRVEIVKPIKPVAPPNIKQVDTSVPTPKSDAIEPIKQDKPKDAAPGLIDNLKGEPVKSDAYLPQAPVLGNGPVTNIPPTPPAPVPDNHIAGAGELSAEAVFSGGIDSFRNKMINKFDSSAFEGQGDSMKTVITFVVEKDGTISGIKANGTDAEFNKEAMRAIKSIGGTWKPAKNKQGENVRSYFKFPITMNFE